MSGDLCVNIKTVKPGFKASAKAMRPDKKGNICRSAHQDIAPKDFETWVSLVKDPAGPHRIVYDLDGKPLAAKSHSKPKGKLFHKY